MDQAAFEQAMALNRQAYEKLRERIRRNHRAGQARNPRMASSRRRIAEGTGRGPGGGGLWLDCRDSGDGRRYHDQRADGEVPQAH